MPFRILLGLILCNLVWSAHPTMGKLVLSDFSPAQAALLRYSSGFASYLLVLALLRSIPATRARLARFGEPLLIPTNARDLLLLASLGFMSFCFSPLLQLTGLEASRATDNALIVAMEPLFTVVLAWIFLRERLTPLHSLAFGVALFGFTLLTGLSPAQLGQGIDTHLMGDLVMLLSLTGEASYSIFGRKLTARHPPMAVFGSSLGFGVLFLGILVPLLGSGQVFENHFTWKSVLGLFWLGPLGTTLAYIYWMFALQEATVASLAITLFIQPVFGSLWSFLFLQERLSAVQALGGSIIICAVVGQSLADYFLQRRSRRASDPPP